MKWYEPVGKVFLAVLVFLLSYCSCDLLMTLWEKHRDGKARREPMKINFTLYKDKAVVEILDNEGRVLHEYEAKDACVRDYHRVTKAHVDNAQAAKTN